MGGGLRAMSGAAAFISAALATEHRENTEQKEKSDYDDAIYNLMANFSLVSSNSGGSWFAHAMLMSPTFNDVLRNMTKRYLAENAKHIFPRNTAKENPFYSSFLAISLKNLNTWNEEASYTDEMKNFQKIQERFQDEMRKGIPVIGGDLALFLKHSFVEGNIWNSFVEILMSPLTSDVQLPPWYKKVCLDWFINVTLSLPKIGPLTTSNPANNPNDTLENKYRDHGSVLRFIRPDNTYLKYITNDPEVQSLEPNYVGQYKRLNDDTFGRVDMVPAAFKVSSEKSEGSEYHFTSPAHNNLSVEYFVADNKHGDPLSSNHIESTVADPRFNFIYQKPLQFDHHKTTAHYENRHLEKIRNERIKIRNKFHTWLKSPRGNEAPHDFKVALTEILYRVAASSAAMGGTSDLTPDYVAYLSGLQIQPKQHTDLGDLLFLNPMGWARGSLVDVIEDFDVSLLFGGMDALRRQDEIIGGLKRSHGTSEWALRGEHLAEECDRFLGEGKLLSYDTSLAKKPLQHIHPDYSFVSSTNPEQPQKRISLRQYADIFPLNVADGGCTDNSGIGRAVMEGATQISSLAFNTDDFLGLFENNEGHGFPFTMYFEIFKCSKNEMGYLKKILNGEDLSGLETEETNRNFTFVCRKTFHQSRGKNRFLKKLFMCKFRDVCVRHNPYYFDLNSTENLTNNVVKEMSVIFALNQEPFGMMGGCLDADFTHYGTWIDEIHSALQNGFIEDGKGEDDDVANMDSKIASAIAFREFIF